MKIKNPIRASIAQSQEKVWGWNGELLFQAVGWTHRGRRSKVNQVYERVKKFKRVHIAPLHTASLRVGVRGGEDVKQRNKNILEMSFCFFFCFVWFSG